VRDELGGEKRSREARTEGRPLEPLCLVVEGEARRVLTDAQIAPDPERTAQGWERRFIADQTRVAEMVQLYRELGYETVVDPIRPADVGESCGECQLAAVLQLQVIYTRSGRESHGA
jgi:hypothetical protein